MKRMSGRRIAFLLVLVAVGLVPFDAAAAPADGPVTVTQADTDKDGHDDIIVENDFVRLVILPSKGGAVSEMRYKKAVNLPFIADKGAGVVGTGRFFVDLAAAQAAGAEPETREAAALADVAYAAEVLEKGRDRVRIRLTAAADAVAPGLTVERTFVLGRSESGFILTRTFRNKGPKPLSIRPGGRFEQKAEPWRTDLRLWMGNGRTYRWLFGPYNAGKAHRWTYKMNGVQWQLMSQYGVGVVARTAAAAKPVDFTVHYPKQRGVPCNAQWLGGPVTLEPGKALTLRTRVLIYEGLRQIGLLSEDRVAATAYMLQAARPGDTYPVFGVAASAERRTVTVGLERYYHIERSRRQVEPLGRREVTLEPGKAVEFRYDMTVPREGLVYATAYVEQDGRRLAAGACRTWVGGDPAKLRGEPRGAVERYLRKMPELHYRGTWKEIGRQLAKERKIKPGKPRANAAEIMKLYREQFPYYADLLEGAAEQLGVPVERLAAAKRPDGRRFALAFTETPADAACMAFYLNGPDGPICAYSKERGGSSVRGQGYMKVLPAKGYKFHIYTLGGWSFGYGINEKGLCTGGATINCDDATMRAGKDLQRKWLAEGKVVAPLGPLMLLAHCATVDDAIAYIENKRAPYAFTGNMLLVDREGNAAVLQSAGIKHMIRRYKGPKDRMDVTLPTFAATNYTHPNDAGEFKPGRNWRWHANALLREWRVNRFVRELKGQVALKDCFWIMRTQNQPGGVCQNGFDNVGHLYTTCSYIAHPRTGDLYLTNGNPWRVHYQHYTLAE